MEKVNVILSRQETKLSLFFYFINSQKIDQNTHKGASIENQWTQPTVNWQLGKSDFLTFTSNILHLKGTLELNSWQNNI